MTGESLHRLLDQMDAWVSDGAWVPDATLLQRWRESFLEAKDAALRQGAWISIAPRAERIGLALRERAKAVEDQQEALRRRLEERERGWRALEAYRPRG